MSTMPEGKHLSEARKASIKKYKSKFTEMRLRVTPEYRDEISAHATRMGESDAAFLRRAVSETMARDAEKLAASDHNK